MFNPEAHGADMSVSGAEFEALSGDKKVRDLSNDLFFWDTGWRLLINLLLFLVHGIRSLFLRLGS
jgi:hypothetical protein